MNNGNVFEVKPSNTKLEDKIVKSWNELKKSYQNYKSTKYLNKIKEISIEQQDESFALKKKVFKETIKYLKTIGYEDIETKLDGYDELFFLKAGCNAKKAKKFSDRFWALFNKDIKQESVEGEAR